MNFFPDVNVLLALTVVPHPEYARAREWFAQSDVFELVLCRHTQLGYLRLLTTRAAMGDYTLTNAQAWEWLDEIGQAVNLREVPEPATVTENFRQRSTLSSASPKRWNDAYLSALANAANLTLVTFDSALADYTPGSVLLKSL